MSCRDIISISILATVVIACAGCASIRASANMASNLIATPLVEYHVGRGVAAMILDRYDKYDDDKAQHYLNLVGQLLAQASDRPETFAGYHFVILKSDEINAFAVPGGTVFVTLGLLLCCSSEDALAAVLAHEIGHVQAQHGLRMIERARATRSFRRNQMRKNIMDTAPHMRRRMTMSSMIVLGQTYATTIGDMMAVLITSGYSRAYENDADMAAAKIMTNVGYDPRALIQVLSIMKERLTVDPRGFAKTHPDPADRIANVTPVVRSYEVPSPSSTRQERFARAAARWGSA